MITATPYQPAEVVPQHEVMAWKEQVRKSQPAIHCPDEVKSFIDAIADKLGDFGQINKYTEWIRGSELMLGGVTEVRGEKINEFDLYPIPVPHMVAVDHHTSMHRLYRRKGKQGLIDYCKVKVKASELERTLEILEVAVFHNESPEFKKVLAEINQAKKITGENV
jgi:hypothetical protein